MRIAFESGGLVWVWLIGSGLACWLAEVWAAWLAARRSGIVVRAAWRGEGSDEGRVLGPAGWLSEGLPPGWHCCGGRAGDACHRVCKAAARRQADMLRYVFRNPTHTPLCPDLSLLSLTTPLPTSSRLPHL